MTTQQPTLERLDERLDAIAKSLDNITHLLNGNGRPGLLDRMTTTESEVRQHHVEMQDALRKIEDKLARHKTEYRELHDAVLQHHSEDTQSTKTRANIWAFILGACSLITSAGTLLITIIRQ